MGMWSLGSWTDPAAWVRTCQTALLGSLRNLGMAQAVAPGTRTRTGLYYDISFPRTKVVRPPPSSRRLEFLAAVPCRDRRHHRHHFSATITTFYYSRRLQTGTSALPLLFCRHAPPRAARSASSCTSPRTHEWYAWWYNGSPKAPQSKLETDRACPLQSRLDRALHRAGNLASERTCVMSARVPVCWGRKPTFVATPTPVASGGQSMGRHPDLTGAFAAAAPMPDDGGPAMLGQSCSHRTLRPRGGALADEAPARRGGRMLPMAQR